MFDDLEEELAALGLPQWDATVEILAIVVKIRAVKKAAKKPTAPRKPQRSRLCLWCEVLFDAVDTDGRLLRYCGKRCRDSFNEAKRRPTRVRPPRVLRQRPTRKRPEFNPVACAGCGKPILQPPKQGRRRRFCSPSCRHVARVRQ